MSDLLKLNDSYAHRQFYRGSDYLLKRYACRFHHAWEPAVGGKSGDRIHFIEHDFPGGSKEHIHSGEAPAPQGAVDSLGGVLDALGCNVIHSGGDMDRVGFQCVFLLIVEETVCQLYFIHLAHCECFIAQDRAAHLKAWDRFLYQNFIVKSER